MKKIVLVIVPLVIILGILFSIFTRISYIDAQTIEIRLNSSDSTENKVIDIQDSKLIEKINSIITARTYYNQPYINSFSRDEIDYELDLREFNDNGKMTKNYKILLNKDKAINTANHSRIDIMYLTSENYDNSKSKSILLSIEQSKKIIELIEPFIQ